MVTLVVAQCWGCWRVSNHGHISCGTVLGMLEGE